jgi:hypothetical protein
MSEDGKFLSIDQLEEKFNISKNIRIIFPDLLSKIRYYPIYIQFEIAFLPRLFLGLK